MRPATMCFLLIVLVQEASSFRCYSCHDCPVSQLDLLGELTLNIDTCDDELFFDITGLTAPQCVKEVTDDGIVNRRCGTKGECKVLLLDKCTSPSEKSCDVCCTSNLCNSALVLQATSLPILAVFVSALISAGL